jgi:superfamily II RNA helicase
MTTQAADCPGTYSTGRAMRITLQRPSPRGHHVVNQEGEYPKCDSCGMFVADTGEKHKRMKMCKDATTRQEKQIVAKAHEAMEKTVVFTINGVQD